MATETKSKIDVYELVTNRIIELLEKDIVPWQQPWTNAGLPQNLLTKKPYAGINVWILASLGYERNYFLTFKQIKDLGGSVKVGEKSCPVVFWKWSEKEDPQSKEVRKVSMIRYYSVFNIDQCVDIPEEKIPAVTLMNNNPIEKCEGIVKGMPKCPKIQHIELEAFYTPVFDYVNMPKLKTFINSQSYYGTLFHELIHATGHQSRLNRKELVESAQFGSVPYGIEELTAELGACYLKSFAGIATDNFSNNASYIYNWLEKIKKDKKLIIYAASKAQRAADYILNVVPVDQETSKNLN